MSTALGRTLIAIVRRKAAENPEFVYHTPRDTQPCMYTHPDGSGGCLIGQALVEAGVINADFHLNHLNNAAFLELMEVLNLPIDGDEAGWLAHVQQCQDREHPWGAAVEYADTKPPANVADLAGIAHL